MKKSMKIIMFCAVVVFLSGGSLLAQATNFNLVDGQPIHSQSDLDSLQTGDTVAMICPKCKSSRMTTYSSDPSSPGHVNWMQANFKTVCKACGGTVTTGPGGKHMCSKCGDTGYMHAYKTAQR
jgi:Zn finger protein HypA/HybF involved in hydrogenase expression